MEGWIKIDRGLLDWEWFDDDAMVRAWLWMLCSAEIEDRSWKGIIVSRGQFVTTLSEMSERLGYSVKKCRIILERLKRTNEVVLKTSNKYTIVTICKYDIYQYDNLTQGQAEGQAEGQTKGKQRANNKRKEESNKEEIESIKETITKVIAKKIDEEEIKAREQRFRDGLNQYSEQYPPAMLQEFADYWTERNPNGYKMKFEKQDTWDISRRLARWSKNNSSKHGNNNYHTAVSNQRDTFASQEELDRRDYTSTIDIPGL